MSIMEIIPQKQLQTPPVLKMASLGCAGAAVGSSTQGSARAPSATATSPTSASAAWAFALPGLFNYFPLYHFTTIFLTSAR